VKLLVPVAVGVPVIAPVVGFNESPLGSVPTVMLHVKGRVPPVACKVALYAVPTTPFGSDVVVTASGAALIVMLRALDAFCPSASVACTVKFVVPGFPVGVPVIAPVEAFSVSPAGSDPTMTLQVIAPVPPLEAKEAL
jgi:hypothetical protein